MQKYINQIPIFFGILVFVFASFQSKAQKKEELQKKQSQLKKEIALTNELIKKTSENKKATQSQLNLISKKIDSRTRLIKSIKSNIFYLEDNISENKKSIDSLKNEVVSLKKDYAQMVYYAYKTKSSYSKLMYVFSAESFNQAYKRLKYIQQFSEFRQSQVREIEKVQLEIETKINELNKSVEDKAALLGDEEKEKEQIQKEKEKQQEIVQELSKEEKKLKADLKKKLKAQEKLTNEIKRIIAEEIRKARIEAQRRADSIKKARELAGKPAEYIPLTPFDPKLSANFASNRGKLPWPVERGVITQGYGTHQHAVLKKVTINNDGVDIGTTEGAEAQAVFAGEVSAVIVIPGAGKAVLIRHGEYLTVYSNLAEVFVKMGDKVTTKQSIGRVLTDKEEGKTEIKFQVWKGTIKLNPSYWLVKS